MYICVERKPTKHFSLACIGCEKEIVKGQKNFKIEYPTYPGYRRIRICEECLKIKIQELAALK